MTAHIQRLGDVGIGVEATSGVAVAPTHYLEISDAPSLKDTYEYENNEAGRSRVELSQGQKLMKKFGEGELMVHLDSTTSVYGFGLILGTVNSSSIGGGLYQHTVTINNTNTPKTATIQFNRVQDNRKFVNAMIEELEIEVSDSFATMKMALKSKESASGSSSASYTTLNRFCYNNLNVRFGDDVASAEIASPTPMTELTLTIGRGAQLVHQTGDTSPQDFVHTTLEIEGEYSQLFDSVVDRDLYLANTPKVMILEFTDNDNHGVKITLPKVAIANWEPSNDLDEAVSQTSEFKAHYDATTNESIRAVVTNNTASYTNLSA